MVDIVDQYMADKAASQAAAAKGAVDEKLVQEEGKEEASTEIQESNQGTTQEAQLEQVPQVVLEGTSDGVQQPNPEVTQAAIPEASNAPKLEVKTPPPAIFEKQAEAPSSISEGFVKTVNTTNKNTYLSIKQKTLLNPILEYTVEMVAKKPVTDAKIIEQQIKLFNGLIAILNSGGPEFIDTWKRVISIATEHKDSSFNERRLFRGFDNIRLSDKDRDAFSKILNLIKIHSTVGSPALVGKQVDLEATLANNVSEQVRNQLYSLYGKN